VSSQSFKLISIAAACIACLAVDRPSRAASAEANISLTASVAPKCKITATEVNFGTYDPVASNQSAALNAASPGSLVVTCTRNASGVTLALNMGTNGSGGNRRMRGASGTSMYLNYQLYQPAAATPGAACAYSAIWGDGTFGMALTPSGTTWGKSAVQTFNVCGQIPGAQEVEQGAYADIVTATVNF
jgi:spore coat protein U-like protein